ncbi:MAG: ribosome-associated translation inhibitor RaiA [Saprospiraceae bacterium]|nr:ribosome-associated translation inhibitor RaiA [Saprospiraceae bacterium]
MIINIQAPFKVTNTEELEAKLETLKKYHSKITRCQVYFKLNDGTQDDVVTAEIEVFIPGEPIFASFQSKQYMEAFKGAFEKAERQLRKLKEKITSHR